METQLRDLLRHDLLFTALVRTDLLITAGCALHHRLHDPMPWSVGPGFMKISMPDRQVDHRRADSHGQVHRPGIVREQEATLTEERGELRTICLPDRITQRADAAGRMIGGDRLLN